MTKERSIGRITMLAMILALGASACSKPDKDSVADTLESIDTVKPLGTPTTADSARLDSSGVQQSAPPPAAPPPRGTLPPPGGETYKQGGTMAPRDPMPPNDPPVKIIGETRREGSTLSPSNPRQRDSTTGPKLQIDSRGNVTPIKR